MEPSDYEADETMDAFGRGDYDRVLALTMPYAVAGNAYAQTQLSLLYHGVERNSQAALGSQEPALFSNQIGQ